MRKKTTMLFSSPLFSTRWSCNEKRVMYDRSGRNIAIILYSITTSSRHKWMILVGSIITIIIIISSSVLSFTFSGTFVTTGTKRRKNIKTKMTADAISSTTIKYNVQRNHYHNILAYGDSFTAGKSDSNFYPYAPYLEHALRNIRRQEDKKMCEDRTSGAVKEDADDSDNTNDDVVVHYRGMPGWTASQMLQNLDDPNTGLRSAIHAIQQQQQQQGSSTIGVSLVILFVGTNDVNNDDESNKNDADDTITNDIISLHQICYDTKVPRTIAIGIPALGYPYDTTMATSLATSINDKIQQYCQNHPSSQATYVSFPSLLLPHENNGEEYWNVNDPYHLSQKGYQVFGESLARIVHPMLLNSFD
jgi:lysophospholipase L1-like esterase